MRPSLILILTVFLSLPLAAQQTGSVPAAASKQPDEQLDIRFLSKTEARKAMTEGVERAYFAHLQIPEMRAKTGLPMNGISVDEAREKTRQHYAAQVQEFTADERAALQGVLSRLRPLLQDKAPLFARTPWIFLKISANVEGGLPHTRGDAIVLSSPLLRSFVQQHLRGDFRELDSFAANMLVHEQTHVVERRRPALFYGLFTEVFGFKRLQPAPVDSWLQEHGVVNPDAPDCGWAYPVKGASQTRWVMPYLVLQNTQTPHMPQDFLMIGVTVEHKGSLWSVVEDKGVPEQGPLSGIAGYAAAFPNEDEFYHPHEIAADLIAHWIAGNGGGDLNHSLRAKIANWGRDKLR